MQNQNEVYKDMARVPQVHRIDRSRTTITAGRICCVKAGTKSILLSLRGAEDSVDPAIQIDEKTRKAPGLKGENTVDFEFREVRWLGQFLWA